jgi:hypothetical protein
MASFKYPVIGQEAVVPTYGLGHVVSFKDDMHNKYIEVKPYISCYPMKFDPENVQLVKINFE